MDGGVGYLDLDQIRWRPRKIRSRTEPQKQEQMQKIKSRDKSQALLMYMRMRNWFCCLFHHDMPNFVWGLTSWLILPFIYLT